MFLKRMSALFLCVLLSMQPALASSFSDELVGQWDSADTWDEEEWVEVEELLSPSFLEEEERIPEEIVFTDSAADEFLEAEEISEAFQAEEVTFEDLFVSEAASYPSLPLGEIGRAHV